jgi:hypothetical protein
MKTSHKSQVKVSKVVKNVKVSVERQAALHAAMVVARDFNNPMC